MKHLSIDQFRDALICAADDIIASEPKLTEIDTIIGDGDHGTTMKSGFTALKAMLKSSGYESMFDLLRSTGVQLLRVMGGASGVIFGTLFIGGHEAVRNKTEMDADCFIDFFDMSCEAIMKRGKARPGDKTMLDALYPAIEAMKERRKASGDMRDIMDAAAEGAKAGAQSSADMLPKVGRSKNFRERGIGYPDPGAVSVSIIFSSMAEYLHSI